MSKTEARQAKSSISTSRPPMPEPITEPKSETIGIIEKINDDGTVVVRTSLTRLIEAFGEKEIERHIRAIPGIQVVTIWGTALVKGRLRIVPEEEDPAKAKTTGR